MYEIIRACFTNMPKGSTPLDSKALVESIFNSIKSIIRNPDSNLNDKETEESGMSSYLKRIANKLPIPKEIAVVIHPRTPILRLQAEIRAQQPSFFQPAQLPGAGQQQAHLLQLVQWQNDILLQEERERQALLAGLQRRAEAAHINLHALQLAQQQQQQAAAAQANDRQALLAGYQQRADAARHHLHALQLAQQQQAAAAQAAAQAAAARAAAAQAAAAQAEASRVAAAHYMFG